MFAGILLANDVALNPGPVAKTLQIKVYPTNVGHTKACKLEQQSVTLATNSIMSLASQLLPPCTISILIILMPPWIASYAGVQSFQHSALPKYLVQRILSLYLKTYLLIVL